jgi:hypothetical protein
MEIGFLIENREINCELLLLFTEDAIEALNNRISYLSE